MKKLKSLKESKVVKSFIDNHQNQKIIDKIYAYIDDGMTISALRRRIEVLDKIIELHGYDNCIELLDEYWETESREKRLLISQGEGKVKEWKEKLANRPKPQNFSIFDKNYWIERKNYTKDAAEKKVSEIQKSIVDNRDNKRIYKNHTEKLKYSKDYWLKRGYTLSEADLLREEYLFPMLTSLESFEHRYGKLEGKKRYNERIKKFKKTYRENIHLRKSAGYVSKESLKFFIPLYKFCRKLGIKREDIYLGVSGSKEFFIRKPDQKENEGRFYDFCIPSLNIVIEYHGCFWHPRKKEEWNNPWVSFEDALLVEREKEWLCKTRKFSYIVVWSDDDKEQRFNEITNLIEERFVDRTK